MSAIFGIILNELFLNCVLLISTFWYSYVIRWLSTVVLQLFPLPPAAGHSDVDSVLTEHNKWRINSLELRVGKLKGIARYWWFIYKQATDGEAKVKAVHHQYHDIKRKEAVTPTLLLDRKNLVSLLFQKVSIAY